MFEILELLELLIIYLDISNGQNNEMSSASEGMIQAALILSVLSGVGVLITAICVLRFIYNFKKKNSFKSQRQRTMSRRGNHPDLMEKASHISAELYIEGTDLTMVPLEACNVCVAVGTLRKVILTMLQDCIANLYQIKVKTDKSGKRVDDFNDDGNLKLETLPDNDSFLKEFRKRLNNVFLDDPSKIELFATIGDNILSASTVRKLLDAMFRVCRVTKGIVKEWRAENELFVGIVPEEGPSHVNFSVDDVINKVKITWDDQKFTHEFLDSISLMLQALRDERRQPTPIEYMAIHLAYHYIASGKQLTMIQHQPLGSPGFRPNTQTYITLADSGNGHVLSTTRLNDWMIGAIVHVGHQKRPSSPSTEQNKPYLIPSLYDFSRVRLHVGSSAPSSYFVCRLSSDTGIDKDDVFHVNMASATASAAFYQGASECVIAMDGFTTSQSIRYMKELRQNIHQDQFSQYLSASWNIDEFLEDDYGLHTTTTLSKCIDTACRTIEITCLGGFDKIVWNCSSKNTLNSIFRLLSFEEILFIVHEAHCRGLITQFNGDIEFGQIKYCVYSGVDGIGLGSDQLCQMTTPGNGTRGPYKEENLSMILTERDEAAESTYGQGALLLTRLDTMYFEGSVSSTENGMRCQLFTAIQNRDDDVVLRILDKMSYILKTSCEYGIALVGEASRLVNSKSPMLKEVADSNYEWLLFATRLRTSVDKNDVKALMEEYVEEPWFTFRHKYLDTLRSRDQAGSGRMSI